MQALIVIWIGSFIYLAVRLGYAAYLQWNQKRPIDDTRYWIEYIPLPILWIGLVIGMALLAPILAVMDLLEMVRPRRLPQPTRTRET